MQEKILILTAFFIGLGSFTPSAESSFGPVAPPELVFSTTTIPHGLYGSAYEEKNLKVTGGRAPYSFSVSGGSLPPGMSLSGDGVFSGTPTAAGTYPFTVTAVDHSRPPGQRSGTQDYTLFIDQAPLTITAMAQTKEYGAADPTLIYTVSGLINGDNTGVLSGGLNRAPGENVGTYPITIGSLSAGSNYTISYTGDYLTITMAPQHITWTQSLLVGCNSTTQIQLTATASSGLPVTYSVSDASVATVSGDVLTLLHQGTTVVTATQTGDANHSAAPAVTDTVFYQPASLIRQHWSDVIFFDNSSGDYVQWQWYKNGEAVPASVSPYYSETPTLNGQYFVVATNKAGRQIQSCTLTITGGSAIAGGINVHPNPAKAGALVIVTSNYPSAELQGAILQIVNLSGRVRQQLTSVQPSMQVKMPSETGIYIINLQLANGQKASTNMLVQD